MSKIYHKPGETYGQWTLVESINKKGWLCRCTCGNTSIVQLHSLKIGRSSRCRECSYKLLPTFQRTGRLCLPGDSGFNRKLRTCKRHASSRNYEWSLTDDQAKILLTSDCYYCGCHPNQEVYGDDIRNTAHSLFICNGIDRVQNDKGYFWENCVSCCGPCNRAKDTMTGEEFLNMARRIASKHPAREIA